MCSNMLKKNKSMRKMRKSDTDIVRRERASSSGSRSTTGSFTSVHAPTAHAILIDKHVVKQVLVKGREGNGDRNDEDYEDANPALIQKQSINKEDVYSEELHTNSPKALSQSKVGPSELEELQNAGKCNDGEADGELFVQGKKMPIKNATTHRTSHPQFRQVRSQSTPPDEHEIDPDSQLARYIEETCWDRKPGHSSNMSCNYHPPEKRGSTPLVPSAAFSLSSYTRYRSYRTNSPYQKPRRPMAPAGLAKVTNTARRVASAKRMTMMDLNSKIKLLQDEIEKLRKENRFLNHLQHRQDNALRKWEGKDAELPRLLNQHKDEIRALQQQLKRAQQQSRDCNEKLSMRDKKILRLEGELDKLRQLVHAEHLQDRHQLQEELDITRMNLIGAEKRISEYMKHVDILEKNHRHQLVAQEKKMIKVNNNTYELQQLVANLRLALRNKDRMLNYIQMRSSGRNLIRAFHAEKAGAEDILYGTCIATDLTRPFQPLDRRTRAIEDTQSQVSSILKSRAMGGNSDFKCEPEEVDEQQESPRKKESVHEEETPCKDNENVSIITENNSDKETSRRKRSPSKVSRSLDSMMRQAPQSVKVATKIKNVPKHRVGKKVIKGPPTKIPRPQLNNKTTGNAGATKAETEEKSRGQSNKSKSKPVQKSGVHESETRNNIVQNEKAGNPRGKSSPSSKTPKAEKVKSNKSRELVYQGSSTAFKYEGPFTKNNKSALQKKSSTQLLYSSKSDKPSLTTSASSSSSYSSTSQSASSTRSEILSNIDILSARIRESCVMVPPPEDVLNSPRILTNKDNIAQNEHSISSSVYLDGDISKPSNSVGPGGDSPIQLTNYSQYVQDVSTPIHSISPRDGMQHLSTSSYNPQVQGMMIVASNNTDRTSPRSFLTQANSQTLSMPNVGFIQLNESSGGAQLTSARIQSFPTTDQSPQDQQNTNLVEYNSPRISHNAYSSFNTVNFLSETSTNYQPNQQIQPPLPRFSTRYPYFSYGTTTPENQASTNVTILQPSSVPLYDPQQFNSTTNAVYSQPGAQLASSPKSSTLPGVGYYNQNSNSGGSEKLPNIASNNPSQSGYNPSYYVNLGSWK